MPLYLNKYNPFFLDTDSPNRESCGSWCHPVALGDTVFVQGYQTPCAASEITDPEFSDATVGAEILTNGGFTGNANGWLAGAGNPLPSDNWAYGTNAADHTAGSDEPLYQTGLGLTAGNTYRVEITFTRTAGSIFVRLGQTVGSTSTPVMEDSGTYTYDIPFLDLQIGDDNLYIVPSTDFAGSIDSVSLKQVTYNSWDLNASWEVLDGKACHITGTTGLLEETVANYINAGDYYVIKVNASGIGAGSVDVYVSDALAGTISSDGLHTFYCTPTLAGVLSFDPTSDFDGCIDFNPQGLEIEPGLYLLKNDHQADVIASDGTRYDISPFIEYYQDYVTLALTLDELELTDGCYTIEIYDACQITGNNLVTDGDFAQGDYTYWTRNNTNQQYSIAANELEFIFEPLEGANLITNGDFATGDFTGWTAGAGWAVVGNAAVHTPGNTGTLSQTVTLANPTIPPTCWIQFVMSAWTAGTITITLSDSTSVTFGVNDTVTFKLSPTIRGSVSFTITPSSNFDGTIDNIALHEANQVWSDFVSIINVANTNILAGNYQGSFEITANTDTTNIGVGINILGQTQSTNYETTISTHTESITGYTPGAQRVRLIAKFRTGNIYYPGRIKVTGISMVRVEPFEATYTSECIDYKEAHPGTRLLTAYCDQVAFGYEFENTGFRLQQRLPIRTDFPSYPSQTQIQRNGDGSARITYAETEKFWIFATDYIDEAAHDALNIMTKCDHFLIGDGSQTEYIVDGEEYAPSWRSEGDYSLATVNLRIRVKTAGQKFNRHL